MEAEASLNGLWKYLNGKIGHLEGQLMLAQSLRDRIERWMAPIPEVNPVLKPPFPPPPSPKEGESLVARKGVPRTHLARRKVSVADRALAVAKLVEPFTCRQMAAKLGWTYHMASGFAVKAEKLGWLHSVKVNGVRQYKRTARFAKPDSDTLEARRFAAAQSRADLAAVTPIGLSAE
jgi:hypothetical protein